MNSKLMTSVFVISTLIAAPVLAEAMDKESSQPKTAVKDSVITTKIKANLAKEKLSTLTNIKVDTDGKGDVTLSGHADSQAQIDQVIGIARATEGVATVKSNIQLKASK